MFDFFDFFSSSVLIVTLERRDGKFTCVAGSTATNFAGADVVRAAAACGPAAVGAVGVCY
jgi:hypothetical protein